MEYILWHNADWTRFVIDIPDSISAAQVIRGQPVAYQLLSCPPQKKEWENNEKASVTNFSVKAQGRHDDVAKVICEAHGEMKNAMQGRKWCNDRFLGRRANYKNLVDGHQYTQTIEIQEPVEPNTADVQAWRPTVRVINDCKTRGLSMITNNHVNADLTRLLSTTSEPKEVFKRLFYNPNPHAVKLTIELRPNDQEYIAIPHPHFWIPPRATFLLSDCCEGDLFHQSVKEMHKKYGHAQLFDLVLMDPPWPNKSAENSGNYKTFRFVEDMRQMWSAMSLEQYIAPGGIVAVWITNRELVRDEVLGPGGLFARWGVCLIEEWYYLKTTKTGDELCDLRDQFRKPYETLLVGKKTNPRLTNSIKTRVFAGVPDLHSRKPVVKEMLELIIGKEDGQYAALEIFARACTSGWMSWGNEVIKHNWERCWVKKVTDERREQIAEEKKTRAEAKKRGENKETKSIDFSTQSVKAGEKRKASDLE
ncbi:MT-A70-domain-containing protein [Macrophomina phaseolina]|uniref:MT-A70-domain-containing protein n=1 Tax=Macrophomina phaseolina TaxID=35725 RepID=A0ABQ8GFL1_9PEZI|nr:MT-A70-domain-containing protein [Macrophomina phaseolina]